ncbi:flagellar biosynthesis protein FlgB [Roseibacterium sp. SDUM158017]|uniref:flagellar basal body rod protein FlgB n=1 Tax=Roseicyclus salinarum TaxID=3036773 RepID=UPI00241575C7|nr:flagellar basal body protein [Roseibacterium sp. SDUM158017]MDG4648622.1 flagellar biosynthesis protein FlgB [Roseibacterium sp. SDUM158017]
MNLSGVSFFNLASQRLSWLGESQRVVAENVANADTPGFSARTTTGFDEMLSGARAAGLSVTDPRHIAGTDTAGSVRSIEDPDAWSTSLDGNTVVLEQQAIRSSELSGSYQLAATLYRKGHEFLQLSVSGNR